jgi:hypothetical protein
MSDPQLQPEAEPHPQKRPRLAFAPISAIERLPEEERWLVEGFLSASSLTVLAASPKAGKTWLVLALAAAVATGTQAMGRYQVGSPGRVLLFAAEDDPRSIRERMESLCAGQNLQLTADLAVDIITADSLKIDTPEDRELLEELLLDRRPRLLVLDPLVRMHSGAESSASHISEVFGYLRQLTRRHKLAIVVTHHLAKSRATGGRQPGHAMRGSGDIHAAYDHGAMLVRQDDGSVLLTLEHRTAASPDPVAYRLVSRPGGGMVFEFLQPDVDDDGPRSGRTVGGNARPVAQGTPLTERVVEVLRAAAQPLSQVAIRARLQVRNAALTEALRQLAGENRARSLGRMGGWALDSVVASESDGQAHRPNEHHQQSADRGVDPA